MLDTNVVASAILWGGTPPQLVDAAKAGVFELVTSQTLLTELLDVLGRKKFAARLQDAGLTPQGIVDDLRRLAPVVSPPAVPRVVPNDPDDDHVLAGALDDSADLVVSGDRQLLVIGSFQGIPIVTASEAVRRAVG
ncbi:MAG: putative toxin-antitoxin system toxin component, PIN family [Betaproteobacteria bacterium]